jgi:hypothetical protein
MRKPQDIKILRALGPGPKDWKELLEITKLSSGGLKYNIDKLKSEKIIKQDYPGGPYYLTIKGENELSKRAIVEGLTKTVRKTKDLLIKAQNNPDRGSFVEIPIPENNVSIAYLYIPSENSRKILPHSPLSKKEKRKLFSSIEGLIKTVYGSPSSCFTIDSEIFHTNLDSAQLLKLKGFASKSNIPNISNAFKYCFEKGLSTVSASKDSTLSLKANKDRWPKIYKSWLKGIFGTNIQNPYLEAMDLLEKSI